MANLFQISCYKNISSKGYDVFRMGRVYAIISGQSNLKIV